MRPNTPVPDSTSLFGTARATRVLPVYAVLAALVTGLFLALDGHAPATPDALAPPATGGHGPTPLASLLLSMAAITLAARATGAFFERWLRQPAVMGEIAAGILLGPSVLGALWPAAQAWVLSPETAPYLGAVAKLGVVLFMFLVGLEVDPMQMRGQARTTLAVSHASIVVPFTLGVALAPWLYPLYSSPSVDFTVFSLFLGISLSVTAFPVLARILMDRGESKSPLGTTALALAAVGDATAWCLLALVSGIARADTSGAPQMLGWVVAFVAVLLLLVRPAVRWLSEREARREGVVSNNVLAAVFALMLLSAVATESIGIHALFGAFLFGVVIPHDTRLARELQDRMASLVGVLLLPVFFAFTGLRTQIGLLNDAADWAVCGAIIAVATAGKLGGTALAARAFGLPWRQAGALGVLMNTRGLMELIVLNVGLDMGVLSPMLFAMLVLMALVTTFLTTPLLTLFAPRTQMRSS
jgi:Kef-type K+ transport system membrane component KefB